MALIKEKEIDATGTKISYWIIDSIEISKLSMSGRIYVSGYKNQEKRKNYPSEGVVERKVYTVPTEDFTTMYQRVVIGFDNLYTVAYKYIKGDEKGVPESVEPDPVWWEDQNGNLSFFSDAENHFDDLT